MNGPNFVQIAGSMQAPCVWEDLLVDVTYSTDNKPFALSL